MKKVTIDNMAKDDPTDTGIITMVDVAKKANVSIATVSNVLNNTRHVSEKLKKKVYDAVQEMNYTPNYWAQSIRKQSGNTLGMIIPNIGNDFYSEVVRGVQDTAFSAGYSVILCNTENNPERWNIYADMLYSKRFDGVVMTGAWLQTQEARDFMIKKGIPIAMINFETEAESIDIVGTSRYLGGVRAAEYLLSLGHREIAVFEGRKLYKVPAVFDVIQGVKDALAQENLSPFAHLVCTEFSMESGYHAMQQLFSTKQLPSTIFCENDLIALGAIRAMKDAGLRIPEDMSIMGFDDIEFAKYAVPNLTSVRVERYRLGQLAVEMILDRIQNPAIEKKRMILVPEIIIRESTAVCKKT